VNSVVVGLGYGDEGKGVTTEYLCSRNPENTLVVRFSGGHQCGHKVVKDGVEHIFANFGSGTLSGCPTYWAKYCTFEPVGFWTEYKLLRTKGASPKVYIHPECPVTTPYDIIANRRGVELKHGTTGVGFFRTKQRHFHDGVRLTVHALLFNSTREVVLKLQEIRNHYGLDNADLRLFFEALTDIRKLIEDGVVIITGRLPDYEHKVFEGSQGLMLDERIGHMPHCTPSDVTPRNVLEMVPQIDEVYLVSRVYQTRHGNGPMTNTGHRMDLVNTEKETNVSHKYQGEFRVSVLDLDQLDHAKLEGIDKIVRKGTPIHLVMTCADQLSKYRVSGGGRIFAFDDVERFVNFVGNLLGVTGDRYVNTSPRSDSIRCVSKTVRNQFRNRTEQELEQAR